MIVQLFAKLCVQQERTSVSLPLPYITIASFSTLPFLFYFIFIQSIVP